jgi:hypothetical protein
MADPALDTLVHYPVLFIPVAVVDDIMGSQVDPLGVLTPWTFPTGFPSVDSSQTPLAFGVVVFNRLDAPVFGGDVTPDSSLLGYPYVSSDAVLLLPKPGRPTDTTKDWIDNSSIAQTKRVAVGVWNFDLALSWRVSASAAFTLHIGDYDSGPTVDTAFYYDSNGFTCAVSHTPKRGDPGDSAKVDICKLTEDYSLYNGMIPDPVSGTITLTNAIVSVRCVATYIFIDIHPLPVTPKVDLTVPPVIDGEVPVTPVVPPPPPGPDETVDYWRSPLRPPPFREDREDYPFRQR